MYPLDDIQVVSFRVLRSESSMDHLARGCRGVEDIEPGTRNLEARSLIAGGERASLLDQVTSLERSNTRLQGTLMMKSTRADRFQRRVGFMERELRQIHSQNGYDDDNRNVRGDGNRNGRGNGDRNDGLNGNGNEGGNRNCENADRMTIVAMACACEVYLTMIRESVNDSISYQVRSMLSVFVEEKVRLTWWNAHKGDTIRSDAGVCHVIGELSEAND
ncbi:hypothetical protein Tco_0308787 [Tanacetum coccineum]